MVDASALLKPVNEAVQEELHWMQRCRKGDEAALGCLIAKHRTRLVRTATNILRDRHEAEDVAQEAFLKAFRELHKLREDRAFSSYLYKICVRLCMDHLRSKRAEPGEINEAQQSCGQAVENRLVVEKLLAQLSPELRTTLVLREMERFSYEDVAQFMHVPIGTVRSRLHTARDRFRRLWIDAMREAV